jgi:DNA-binding MarR family transcriptional regulator
MDLCPGLDRHIAGGASDGASATILAASRHQEVPMPKLTDTQLVILNAAAGRESRAVLPLPKLLKVNKGTATSVLKALLAKGLVEEARTTPDMESWRQDGDGHAFMLTISAAGIAALDGNTDTAPKKRLAPRASTRTAKAKATNAPTTRKASGTKTGTGKAKTGGKVQAILALLQRPDGARLTDLEKATGWQPHSVRAALTGLRKRGIKVTRERKDQVTTYFAEVA